MGEEPIGEAAIPLMSGCQVLKEPSNIKVPTLVPGAEAEIWGHPRLSRNIQMDVL